MSQSHGTYILFDIALRNHAVRSCNLQISQLSAWQISPVGCADFQNQL